MQTTHWLAPDDNGKDREMHPRHVDVFVQRPVDKSHAGRDSHLDAAAELLKGVGRVRAQ